MQLESLQLKQDVQTRIRWNSVYYKLERLYKVKVPLSGAISLLPGCPDNINADE